MGLQHCASILYHYLYLPYLHAFPEDNTKNISLIVSLPGTGPQAVSASPSSSIDALLTTLLQGRPRLPVGDVRISSSGSLASITGKWREMTLETCGAGNGDHFSVQAAAPAAVFLMVCEPHRSRPTDSTLLHLEPEEWSWRAIRKKAQRHFKVAISPHANASQFVRFLQGDDGKRRRALWSYREETEDFFFADEDSGNQIDLRKAPQSVLEFLAPSSGLRWAKHKTPILQVDTNCDYLCMSAEDDEFEEFDPQDTVFTTKWLVLLLGLRYWSSSGWQNFIRIKGGLIFHQQTGEEFGDIEAVVRSRNKVSNLSWRKFFLFMKEGDLLPKGNVPKGRTLAIYRREGLFLDVRDKRLVLRGAKSEGTESTWSVPTDQVEFDEKFMKEMRQ